MLNQKQTHTRTCKHRCECCCIVCLIVASQARARYQLHERVQAAARDGVQRSTHVMRLFGPFKLPDYIPPAAPTDSASLPSAFDPVVPIPMQLPADEELAKLPALSGIVLERVTGTLGSLFAARLSAMRPIQVRFCVLSSFFISFSCSYSSSSPSYRI